MRFRPQRGMFEDSMKECVEVHSLAELEAILKGNDPLLAITFVRFKRAAYDFRKEWNAPTFYVIGRDIDGTMGVVGMTDKDTFE